MIKKCKVCNKVIRSHNKSMLCSHCYQIQFAKKRRKERRKRHLCITCGTKINPIMKLGVKYYYVRCPRCKNNQKIYSKKHYILVREKMIKNNKKYYRDNIFKIKEYYQKPEVKKRIKEYQQREDVILKRKKQRQLRKSRSVTPLK